MIEPCLEKCNPGVLLQLLRHVTTNLGRFDPNGLVHTRSLSDFLQDLETAQYMVQHLSIDDLSTHLRYMTEAEP